jgi:acetylornithine deacetylase/succinyl-diaminopimelate desuccinylase-like protein
MTDFRSIAIDYAHQHRDRFLADLVQLLRIPSVSTHAHNLGDMLAAAETLRDRLTGLGFEQVQIFPTAGHPVVFGEYNRAAAGAPTVLIYGHYDVQPAEPLGPWHSDPFEPVNRDQRLYARGASDMKGQVIATFSAVEAILQAGQAPVKIKFLLEGEEEIGSPNLPAFIENHRQLLACDIALNPDAGMISADDPTIVYALRGLAYFELRVFGPRHDLHSGMFGGVIHNPAQVLCDLIAGMHDANGRITLPGYYAKVRALDEMERKELARLPIDDEYYLSRTGAPALWGESGYSPVERIGARPTLEINGMLSGFTGPGSKTVLPAWAMAKISMRLVPDQDPADVHRQLEQYLHEHAPQAVRWELDQMAGGPASIIEQDNRYVQALVKAFETTWKKKPVYKREGGSIPVVADMKKILGVESVLTGFGLPDDQIHGPNEKLELATWYTGIDALIHFFYNIPETGSGS